MGPTGEYADNHLSVIPDFIANCGMARVFAFLMHKEIELTDETIFRDVSHTIEAALKKIHVLNSSQILDVDVHALKNSSQHFQLLFQLPKRIFKILLSPHASILVNPVPSVKGLGLGSECFGLFKTVSNDP